MVSHFVWFWHKFFVSFVSVKAVSFSDSIPMRTVATSPVVLRWLCDSPRTGCAWRITTLCMWREQAIIEWSRWSDLGEWPLTMLVNLVNSWWCLLTVTTRVISSGDLYCCLLKHCFLNIIYVRPDVEHSVMHITSKYWLFLRYLPVASNSWIWNMHIMPWVVAIFQVSLVWVSTSVKSLKIFDSRPKFLELQYPCTVVVYKRFWK